MEMHQLRYLVAVAQTGNFSRGAERCHVSQPSLSQQIKRLEEELGERLFDRMKREAKLTPHGRLFLQRAMRILDEVDAARREASEARALTRGSITMGVLPTIAPYLLPRVLPGFGQRFPDIQIVVQEDTTAQLLAALAVCELDFAIASLPIHDERVHAEPLFKEELLVALCSDHPLADKKSIRLTDLESEPFILMKEGHCLGDQVLSFCAGRDFHPRVLCRSTQVETIRALVRVGMGISLVPAMACEGTRSPKVTYRSLAAPTPQRTIVALWRSNRPPGRALSAFMHALQDTVARSAQALQS